MAHAQHNTTHRALRREVVGTIGLLADAEDFAAMRRYRTFTFHDHTTYLREVEQLLRTLAAEGKHTTLALFDPEEYEEFCTHTGLDPDTPDGRTRFTAALAAAGPTVTYDGRPLDAIVPDLIDETLRHSTLEYGEALLSDTGRCAECGEDIGVAAFTRAAIMLSRILDTAPTGTQHIVCSITRDSTQLLGSLHAERTPDGLMHLDQSEALEATTVLAVGIATQSPGGLVRRTTTPDHPDRVCGWRLNGEHLQPLTEAQVFDAYCTDAHTGEPVPPEPGLDYAQAPDLGPYDDPHAH
ncbi:hypothetical protein QIS99_30735 [Streptomyces sp. B-S-A8]|uniref:Uncharacterized protein n=1 Tax=Streptomyces solicavernae TaxID=3043614 RepID=A0ABT6S1I5_9ACTN|nr:hypothetical protein [Streptomyces sp. B-S-A8]MDI3390539.1 hypothetical protein [Streptomyces sp. B-S-A8]